MRLVPGWYGIFVQFRSRTPVSRQSRDVPKHRYYNQFFVITRCPCAPCRLHRPAGQRKRATCLKISWRKPARTGFP